MNRPVLALLLIPLAASACVLPGMPGASSGAADFAEAGDPSTEPVRVRLSTDDAHAATAEIPAEGGSLSTTGADGTRFTLEIPTGALLAPTTITMTPIASMDGLPTPEGLAAAVEFEPDGMVLYEVARLTIDLAEPVGLDQQIPIGVSGDEHDLELAFSEVLGDTLQLQLLHFSSAGVAKGTLADLEPVRRRLGGSAEARLRSLAIFQSTLSRQRQLVGVEDTGIDPAFLESFVREFRALVLGPRLNAAEESCAAGRLALLTYFEFQRTLQLLGHPQADEGFSQEILGLIPTIARQCITEEYEMCRDDHIAHHILLAITEIERQIQLLGLEGASLEAAMEEARQLAAKCLRFELKFESEVSGSAVNVRDATSTMTGTALLLYDPRTGKITGDAPLENSVFEVGEYLAPPMKCIGTGSPGPAGPLTVYGVTFLVKHRGPDDPLGYVADLVLNYDTGQSSHETLEATCSYAGMSVATGPVEVPIWAAGFTQAHVNEVSVGEAGGAFQAEGWTVEGGDLFAELEWDLSAAALSGSEKGFFELYHRPE